MSYHKRCSLNLCLLLNTLNKAIIRNFFTPTTSISSHTPRDVVVLHDSRFHPQHLTLISAKPSSSCPSHLRSSLREVQGAIAEQQRIHQFVLVPVSLFPRQHGIEGKLIMLLGMIIDVLDRLSQQRAVLREFAAPALPLSPPSLSSPPPLLPLSSSSPPHVEETSHDH